MTNSVNIVRVTKAQKYDAIIKALETADNYAENPVIIPGTTLKDGTVKDSAVLDISTLVEFCQAEIEALSKKTSKSNKTQNKNQQENEELKEYIVDFLTEQDDMFTCTQIEHSIPEIDGKGNQRVTRLVGALVKEGRIQRTVVKGTPYFSIQ